MSSKNRIISASRRTDIPAHYFNWFKNRVMAGFCKTRNPFNPNQVKTISLLPGDVDIFVFWSRNPLPMMNDREFFDYLKTKFNIFFLFTLNGYPKELEPNLPSLQESIGTFRELSRMLPAGSVAWRYDPVLISGITNMTWHRENFRHIAKSLSGSTDRVIISIFDPYAKAVSRLQSHGIDFRQRNELVESPEFRDLMKFMRETADDNGMEMAGCCESLADFGIGRSSCIDADHMNSLFHLNLPSKKDKSQRNECRCSESTDIGAYNTCVHGCLYCYAVRDFGKAEENYGQHDEMGEFLLG